MKKYVYFAMLIALSLAACIPTFVQLAGGKADAAVFIFGINFPVCLLLCVIYYKLIFRLSRIPFFKCHRRLRILSDWLCATTIGSLISIAGHRILNHTNSELTITLTFILWNSIVVLGVELYVYHRSVLEKEKLLARLEKEKAAYQFEALKQQINPHFLFNSLNALASLAYQDAEKTNLFAKKLSSVYRYLLLTADKRTVPLRDELAFLRSYLYLEDIRFGSAMRVSVNIPDQLLFMHIVPASLQLLVENALKHNIATVEKPLHIAIASLGNKLTVANNLQPRGEVATNKKGLQNLKRQYEACGGNVKIEKSDALFSVTLPLQEA